MKNVADTSRETICVKLNDPLTVPDVRTESDVPEDVSVVVVVISLVIEVPLLLVPASLLIPMLNPSTPVPGRKKSPVICAAPVLNVSASTRILSLLPAFENSDGAMPVVPNVPPALIPSSM